MHRSMRVLVLLITMLTLAGCGIRGNPEREVPEKPRVNPQSKSASAEPQPSETNDVDHAYAKGVVILKTGEKVSGHILLQCPGYLTVCFKVDSSEPNSAQLVRNEDVQSVLLEAAWEDVDPYWKELQKEMTVMTGQGPAGDSRTAASEK